MQSSFDRRPGTPISSTAAADSNAAETLASVSPAEDIGERDRRAVFDTPRHPSLDAILLSHPHGDHAGGVAPVLRALGATLVADSGQRVRRSRIPRRNGGSRASAASVAISASRHGVAHGRRRDDAASSVRPLPLVTRPQRHQRKLACIRPHVWTISDAVHGRRRGDWRNDDSWTKTSTFGRTCSRSGITARHTVRRRTSSRRYGRTQRSSRLAATISSDILRHRRSSRCATRAPASFEPTRWRDRRRKRRHELRRSFAARSADDSVRCRRTSPRPDALARDTVAPRRRKRFARRIMNRSESDRQRYRFRRVSFERRRNDQALVRSDARPALRRCPR